VTLPRKGTMAAQLAKPEFTIVQDVEGMPYGNFLRHCRERHRDLPFVTRNEHEQMHRLRPPKDHKHKKLQTADEPPSSPATKAARRRSTGE
jgi:hypothetical protein